MMALKLKEALVSNSIGRIQKRIEEIMKEFDLAEKVFLGALSTTIEIAGFAPARAKLFMSWSAWEGENRKSRDLLVQMRNSGGGLFSQ